MKNCPHCDKEIQDAAKKCKHCKKVAVKSVEVIFKETLYYIIVRIVVGTGVLSVIWLGLLGIAYIFGWIFI